MDKKTHRTGLEGYYAVDEKNRKLRYGYTTGSCAAAPAQAATRMLLTGEKVDDSLRGKLQRIQQQEKS